MRSLLVDPFNPRHLYAASVTDVYSSEDAGETWKWYPAGGLDYREIWTMSVHPTRPNEVYLGTLPAMVYISENGGRSFSELGTFRNLPDYVHWTFPPAPHTPNVRCVALDSRVPNELLVGVEEGGVVKSSDGGRTWLDVSGPLRRGCLSNGERSGRDRALPASQQPAGSGVSRRSLAGALPRAPRTCVCRHRLRHLSHGGRRCSTGSASSTASSVGTP